MINFASIIFLKEYSLSHWGRGGISIFRRSILLEIHMLATQAANYGGAQQILQEASETWRFGPNFGMMGKALLNVREY